MGGITNRPFYSEENIIDYSVNLDDLEPERIADTFLYCYNLPNFNHTLTSCDIQVLINGNNYSLSAMPIDGIDGSLQWGDDLIGILSGHGELIYNFTITNVSLIDGSCGTSLNIVFLSGDTNPKIPGEFKLYCNNIIYHKMSCEYIDGLVGELRNGMTYTDKEGNEQIAGKCTINLGTINNIVGGENNIAGGSSNYIAGENSMVLGDSNESIGEGNIVLGSFNDLGGNDSIVYGRMNTNNGSSSMTGGCRNIINSVCKNSVIFGEENESNGIDAFVSGYSLYTNEGRCGTYIGRYNIKEQRDKYYDVPTYINQVYFSDISERETVYFSDEYSFDKNLGKYTLLNYSSANTTDFTSMQDFCDNIGKYFLFEKISASFINFKPHQVYSDRAIFKVACALTSKNSLSNYILTAGNGVNGIRSNAHTLDWDGNAWYAGTVEGTAFILNSSTEGSSKRFQITVDDSGTITATEIIT